MALNEKENHEYEKWLEEAEFEESLDMSPSSALFKKNYGIAWIDEKGNKFRALSNQKIWEAGYDWCKEHSPKMSIRWNNDSDSDHCINFKLTHEELHNLIHAMNEHTTNKLLLQRLNKADEAWVDFKNSRAAEEIGG